MYAEGSSAQRKSKLTKVKPLAMQTLASTTSEFKSEATTLRQHSGNSWKMYAELDVRPDHRKENVLEDEFEGYIVILIRIHGRIIR